MNSRTDNRCDGNLEHAAIGAPSPQHWDSLRRRLEHARDADLTARLRIEPGALDDYRALAKFHYRRAHPGVVTSVIRIVHRGESAVDRFAGRGEQVQIVGVLVRSLPALACGLREIAAGGRYSDLKPSEAAAMLNREVRTISRVVIDPQWRGLGLAVKLVRHALEHPEHGIIFTEALAAMGRICPFFERAGMTRYERPLRARARDARLLDALESARDHAQAPDFLLHELRRWHRTAHHTCAQRLRAMSFDVLMSAARCEFLARPLYFAFQHGPCPSMHDHMEDTHAADRS